MGVRAYDAGTVHKLHTVRSGDVKTALEHSPFSGPGIDEPGKSPVFPREMLGLISMIPYGMSMLLFVVK